MQNCKKLVPVSPKSLNFQILLLSLFSPCHLFVETRSFVLQNYIHILLFASSWCHLTHFPVPCISCELVSVEASSHFSSIQRRAVLTYSYACKWYCLRTLGCTQNACFSLYVSAIQDPSSFISLSISMKGNFSATIWLPCNLVQERWDKCLIPFLFTVFKITNGYSHL